MSANSLARVVGGIVIIVVGLLCVPLANADLAGSTIFDGFEAVFEEDITGLRSTYDVPTRSGNNVPDVMFSLSGQRVSYPGVGEEPSPGLPQGRAFDEGAMGLRVNGANLVVRVAGRLDPLSGVRYNGTWYGQGDVFVTVQDTDGVSQFALLNSWARRNDGQYRNIGRGYFNLARSFHAAGGKDGASLEGHLVELALSGDVALVGGPGSYSPTRKNNPPGLDYRTYAQGRIDDPNDPDYAAKNANLQHAAEDLNPDPHKDDVWYIQTWEFPASWISDDHLFDIGLHKTASCGNDQIGMLSTVSVPIPPNIQVSAPRAAVLGMIGLTIVGWVVGLRRRTHMA